MLIQLPCTNWLLKPKPNSCQGFCGGKYDEGGSVHIPTDSEISGIDNIFTFTGTPLHSELEEEGSQGKDRSPSSESLHGVQTESCLDNFVPTQSVEAEKIPRTHYNGPWGKGKSRGKAAQPRHRHPKVKWKIWKL